MDRQEEAAACLEKVVQDLDGLNRILQRDWEESSTDNGLYIQCVGDVMCDVEKALSVLKQ